MKWLHDRVHLLASLWVYGAVGRIHFEVWLSSVISLEKGGSEGLLCVCAQPVLN